MFESRGPTDPHSSFPRFLEDLGQPFGDLIINSEHTPRQYVYMLLKQRIPNSEEVSTSIPGACLVSPS
jgi:hypothetical protein